MPPPEETVENAVNTLGTITLESFTATPNRVRPTNDVTLKWKATKPTGPVANRVRFRLMGSQVSNTGTKVIHPVRSTSVSLVADAFGVQSTLGTVAVEVVLSGCFVNSVPDSQLAAQFAADMEAEYPRDTGKKIELTGPDATVRVRNTRLRVETGGILVSGEFSVELNNAPDGELEIEARIGLGAENGRPVHKIQKFSADFEFAGLTSILTAGLAEVVDRIIDSVAGGFIKKSVDASIGKSLGTAAGVIPSGFALSSVAPATRRIDVTVCPTSGPV